MNTLSSLSSSSSIAELSASRQVMKRAEVVLMLRADHYIWEESESVECVKLRQSTLTLPNATCDPLFKKDESLPREKAIIEYHLLLA